jgi:BirA family biotin operon repressor/biotin-[acetyl-CoA-carboxylase] ligase
LARAAALIHERGIAIGAPLTIVGRTTSTNDLAKQAAREGAPHGATFVAEEQTEGRGRQGRAWLAGAGESLLMSVVLRVTCPPARLPPLALVAGLATRDAVARWTRETPRIKWPNDVMIGERKIAGVLVEGILQGTRVEALVVGIGINVHARAFPDEIASLATSIALAAKSDEAVDRGELLADLLVALDRDIALASARGLGLVHARLTQFDALRGLRVSGDEVSGTAEGIDLDGRLLVRGDDGILRRCSAGEVRVSAPRS